MNVDSSCGAIAGVAYGATVVGSFGATVGVAYGATVGVACGATVGVAYGATVGIRAWGRKRDGRMLRNYFTGCLPQKQTIWDETETGRDESPDPGTTGRSGAFRFPSVSSLSVRAGIPGHAYHPQSLSRGTVCHHGSPSRHIFASFLFDFPYLSSENKRNSRSSQKEGAMKTTLAIGVAILSATLGYARSGDVSRPAPDLELTEAKLIDDVHCENCETKESAIFDLGELRSEKAVIPLMDVLHRDDDESSRVVAALALCRIGDARGTFAVKRAATFDKSEKVRTLSAWFYNTYVREGSFQFEPAPAAMASKN